MPAKRIICVVNAIVRDDGKVLDLRLAKNEMPPQNDRLLLSAESKGWEVSGETLTAVIYEP